MRVGFSEFKQLSARTLHEFNRRLGRNRTSFVVFHISCHDQVGRTGSSRGHLHGIFKVSQFQLGCVNTSLVVVGEFSTNCSRKCFLCLTRSTVFSVALACVTNQHLILIFLDNFLKLTLEHSFTPLDFQICQSKTL